MSDNSEEMMQVYELPNPELYFCTLSSIRGNSLCLIRKSINGTCLIGRAGASPPSRTTGTIFLI